MASMAFCGHTGKVFHGTVTPWSAWKTCDAPERPSPDSLPIKEEWYSCSMAGHRECPLYLSGARRKNSVPFRWSPTTDGLGINFGTGIAVSGEGSEENRKLCGQYVRNRLTAEQINAADPLPRCSCGMGDATMPELHAQSCAINAGG